MSNNTMTQARVHEHAGRVAILLSDDVGEYGHKNTLYLSPDLAAQLAQVLQSASVQVRNGYHFPSTGINREV